MFFPEKAPAEHGGDQSHQLPSQDSDGGQRGQRWDPVEYCTARGNMNQIGYSYL